MTAEKIALYMQALQAHLAKATGVQHVMFIHPKTCRCASGHLPLDQCECVPIIEISGKRYQLAINPQLVPVKP